MKRFIVALVASVPLVAVGGQGVMPDAEANRQFAQQIAQARKCETLNTLHPIKGTDLPLTCCTFTYKGMKLWVGLGGEDFRPGVQVQELVKVSPKHKAPTMTVYFDPYEPCLVQVSENGQKLPDGSPKFLTAYVEVSTARVFTFLDKPKCSR